MNVSSGADGCPAGPATVPAVAGLSFVTLGPQDAGWCVDGVCRVPGAMTQPGAAAGDADAG